MNDERQKRQEEIERAMSYTLSVNRMSAPPATLPRKVGKSDITKRERQQGIKRDQIHNEVIGMFGRLADTEIIIQ